jgi:hypothetical protein
MNQTQIEIMDILLEEWTKHPQCRFGQILTALNVIEFVNKEDPEVANFDLRDIFADEDERILKRIKTAQKIINSQE